MSQSPPGASQSGRRDPEYSLWALGIDAETEAYYRDIVAARGGPVREVTSTLGLPADPTVGPLARLVELGLVVVRDDHVIVPPPRAALERIVTSQLRQVMSRRDELVSARATLTDLTESVTADLTDGSVAVEIVPARRALEMLVQLTRSTSGEMLFVRQHWHLVDPGVQRDTVVDEQIRRGREVRSLYDDVTVLEAPLSVERRVQAGEQVRVVPRLPARLAVFGDEVALVPERWDDLRGGRLVVREPGLVSALRAMVDAWWDRGRAPFGDPSHDRQRVELMQMLADGHRDDQIARATGLSLRTVRRRVADAMDALGATSRFQAGAEAVRRGWI